MRAFAASVIDVLMAGVVVPNGSVKILQHLEPLLADLKREVAGDPSLPAERYVGTEAHRVLTGRFGARLPMRRLSAFAAAVAEGAHLPPPGRKALRRKALLLQWFADHWAAIAPLVPGLAHEGSDDAR
jgi:hypothetical protein